MGQTELTISGCKVKFPGKPYRSQIAMMAKIIGSLQRSQNALLESPTGSGKSLALLCSSLAWQESEQKKVDEFNSILEQATANQDPAMRDALLAMGGPGVEMQDEPVGVDDGMLEAGAIALAQGGFIPGADDDDDFVEPNAKRPRHAPQGALGVPAEDSVAYHLPGGGDLHAAAAGPKLLRMPKRKQVPKIYFGTRTHKQVAQIVRELKKTAYSGVRMTILGSREHTCIHPTISRSFNKNQDCQELMDKKKGGGCRFQHNVKSKLASHASLRTYMGHSNAWDLEDIVKVGKKVKCCPYFTVRELKKTAQLIICPYNYLVDPKIRKSMEISLNNQVMVLDEAHNIEDSARDAVSGTFTLEDIGITLQECERMKSHGVIPETHGDLADFCSRLAGWMQRSIEGKPDYNEFNSSSRVWTGTKGVAEWNELVFAPATYGSVKCWIESALKEQEAAKEEQEAGEEASPALSKKASEVLEGISMLLEYMFIKDSVYRDDYRMAVVKSQTRKKGGARGWVGKGENNAMVTVITLSFWCLNPAVCFDELKDELRSVVLTSGTLSPMETFASELDVKFPITLEADHVIDRKQIWAGTLSHGPTGQNLKAVYKNTETVQFQDEIGRLVLGVCRKIPHGVLVFLSSYKMLDNLVKRWQMNGTWADICAKKTIVSEPRFSDQLDTVMREYYEAIIINKDPEGMDGALFLAVCRGKVSEGLDFADNNARAVICVGIPFPNVKDSLVDLKKKYNDKKRATIDHNILSGNQWYEIQAFRALNQALGRCIRHKKDWGAILMVDDRYKSNERYTNSLSRWVRKSIIHYGNTNDLFSSLNNFTTDMKHMDEEIAAEDAAAAETLKAAEAKLSTEAKLPLPDSDNLEAAVDETTCSISSAPSSHSSAWSSSSYAMESTIAAKLAKLKDYGRQVTKKLEDKKKKTSNPMLDSQTHLNSIQHLNVGKHLNALSGSDHNKSVEIVEIPTTNKVEVVDLVENDCDLAKSHESPDFDIGDVTIESDNDVINQETNDLNDKQREEERKSFEANKKKIADDIFSCNEPFLETVVTPVAAQSVITVSDDDSKENINSSLNSSRTSRLKRKRNISRDQNKRRRSDQPSILQFCKPKQGDGFDTTISIPREVLQPAAPIMDEITSASNTADSPWAELIRQRKQKKLLNSSKSTDTPETNATVVPNSAEKASKWQDEDIVYPSDEETSKPRFAVRKPLFKTRNSSAESFISNSSVGLASTVSDVAGTVSKLTGTVPEVVVPLQDSPLQQQTVHKQEPTPETSSSSSKKKTKKRRSDPTTQTQARTFYDSDDDFV